MTLEDADKIMNEYGKYLEHSQPVVMFMAPKIPESLLPFPKNIISEAMDIMIEYVMEIGNRKAEEEMMRGCLAFLPLYVNDHEALLYAAEKFKDEEYRNVFCINIMKDRQTHIMNAIGIKDV